MDGTKTTTNWIIAGLVALVVIIGGGWLIARERSGTMADANATSTGATSSEETTASENTNPTKSPSTKPSARVANPTTSASGEMVTVNDQPAGSTVVVGDVTVSKPTWVAVRDSRPWYLGWKLVKSSEQNVSVPLQRATAAGESYEVVLFVDNGDGTFAIHGGDMLVTSANGSAPVSSTFKAQ